jgi:hypothetical protein
MDDVDRLAADLGRFLDELPDELGASRAGSAERDGRKASRARALRRERLEQYVDGMSTARRLRLAGALHLLSRRLDEDLAHPDQREAATAASPAPSPPGDPARPSRAIASTAQRRSVADPRIAIAAKR